jgi:hypothetical protein
LHEHDDFGSLESAAVTWDSDDFLDRILFEIHRLFFGFQKSMHVENVSCCLDFVVSKCAHRLEGFLMAILAHIPSRRFWAHENKDTDDDSGQHRGT